MKAPPYKIIEGSEQQPRLVKVADSLLQFTMHARIRMWQRGITVADIIRRCAGKTLSEYRSQGVVAQWENGRWLIVTVWTPRAA